MGSNETLKQMIIASMGLITTSTSDNITYVFPTEVSYVLSHSMQPSSTNFNNRERYSLEKLKYNKSKLESFKSLGYNWNGYESSPFPAKLISKVENLLTELEYQPQVFPTGRGSIQIEKYLDEQNLIEIEISEEDIFMYQVKNGKEIEISISFDEINSHISELYG